jgi:hypothetical protein
MDGLPCECAGRARQCSKLQDQVRFLSEALTRGTKKLEELLIPAQLMGMCASSRSTHTGLPVVGLAHDQT